MKKLLTILLATTLMASGLCACSQEQTPSDTTPSTTTTVTDEVETTTTVTESTTTESVSDETTETIADETATEAVPSTTVKAPATTKKPTTTTTTKNPNLIYKKEVDTAAGYRWNQCWLNDTLDLDPNLIIGKVRYRESDLNLDQYFDRSTWETDNYYHIPEDAMLDFIRSIFVYSDAQFEALKAVGTYSAWLENDCFYKDGEFLLTYEYGQGGAPSTAHHVTSFEDNKQGVAKVFFEFIDDSEPVRYVMEYTYTGESDLAIETSEYDNGEDIETLWHFTSHSEELLKSLRIRSIKAI